MANIKAIIIDLGAVIININQQNTIEAFKKLGVDLTDLGGQSPFFDDFETGKISQIQFLNHVRNYLPQSTSEAQIVTAWNHMLLDIPQERMRIIKQLKETFKVYLLSNTNEIHMQDIYRYADEAFGKGVFTDLFDAVFLSYQIGLRKPDLECYHFVLNKIGIAANQAIFIDDNEENIAAAATLGLKTVLAKQGLGDWIFDEMRDLDAPTNAPI